MKTSIKSWILSCVIKHMLTFENYKESVLKNKTILRSQLRFKSDGHNVYTEEINKIAIRNNDDKRFQTFNDNMLCIIIMKII